jgi:hypothetical protein
MSGTRARENMVLPELLADKPGKRARENLVRPEPLFKIADSR